MNTWLKTAMASVLVLGMAGCGTKKESSVSDEEPKVIIIEAEDGFASGNATDIMRTAFFDFSIDSAYTADSYQSFAAEEGNQLLIAQITIKNTMTSSIPMFDTDFQAQWGDDEDDQAFSFPLTAEGDAAEGEMLPEEYELAINESRTGLLVFQVPADKKDFSVSYQEIFDTQEKGDTFFVYFTALHR